MLNFDFMGKKTIWFALSGVLIILSLIGIFAKGFNYSIDFKGGSSSTVWFEKNVAVDDIRQVINTQNLGESKIQPVEQNFGADLGAKNSAKQGHSVLIRTKKLSTAEEKTLFDELNKKFGVIDRQTRTVDASWGNTITERAIYALITAMVLLLIFIAVRYEFKMSVAAVLALLHDLIITAGIYALIGREVNPNMIAALLTILGFSLYDTIVVFNRIKENSTSIVKTTYSAMANRSMNQVLMRSINTSLVTLLPVISILLFGGETLKDFAFALLIGTISGAYSSIFFAAPIFVAWKESEPYYKTLKKKYGSEVVAPASAS
jgi:SecD/SecF fusion protein